ISSVAKVTLKTCTDGQNGHEIYAEDGAILNQKPAKAKQGTDILVESLFYNTPARLKYVKSLYTELGKITDIVNRMAMSHPDVRFTLVSDGKVLIKTNGSGRTNEVMAEIYGMKVAKDLVHITGDTSDYHLEGYVAKPEHSRSNRHYISIFINGRYIKNFILNKAILEGYHTLLTIGRYPICYINIEMDPILVDVNVHPTKLEVRLSKEEQLYDLIVEKIRDAFKDKILIPHNDENKLYKKNKVLESFEQQKLDFEKRNQQQSTQTSNDLPTTESEPEVSNEQVSEKNTSTSDYQAYQEMQKAMLSDLEEKDNQSDNDDALLNENEATTHTPEEAAYDAQPTPDVRETQNAQPKHRVP
ncbi:MAG: DNA mismatch repair endonuclease MutL, partial [Staphylococcus simulans]|nr:DNA mismatch repair endonuclease MutL [Staphylococcus simulans]